MASPDPLAAFRAQRLIAWLAAAMAMILPASLLAGGRLSLGGLAISPRGLQLHTLLLAGWLALLMVRLWRARPATSPSTAGYRGERSLPLAVLVGTLILLGAYNGTKALVLHTWPAAYSGVFFLALTGMTALTAGILLTAGLLLRLAAPAQDRLLAGGTAILLQPQLADLLPMHALGGEAGQWLITALFLAGAAWIARRDRQAGAQHERTSRVVAVVMLGSALLTSLLPHVWPFEVVANRLMAHQLPFTLPGR
ncbi:MAG: hypothetical protein KGL54_12825 [Sphingomonadales bacterium]|nr:hypothetical protein [Sphingomonadales bacterium]